MSVSFKFVLKEAKFQVPLLETAEIFVGTQVICNDFTFICSSI